MNIRRVLYACTEDPSDVLKWSGLVYYIGKMLTNEFEHVEPVLLSKPALPIRERFQAALSRRLYKSIDLASTEMAVNRDYGRQIDSLLSKGYDAVFTHAPRIITCLESEVPTFAYTDALYPNLTEHYPGFQRVRPYVRRIAMKSESLALRRLTRLFVTTEWARQAAIRDYGAPGGKVIVVPWGGNSQVATESSAAAAVASRSPAECHLLFLGVSWERKGGAIALEAARILNERGVPATLHIAGLDPPTGVADLPFVKTYGFLNKQRDVDRSLLQFLLEHSHFLLLPTRAEAYGLVAVEAYSNALPIVVTEVDGIAGLVKQGETGYLVDYRDTGAGYADVIQSGLASRSAYEQMCWSGLRWVQEELNWKHAGRRVREAMNSSSLPA